MSYSRPRRRREYEHEAQASECVLKLRSVDWPEYGAPANRIAIRPVVHGAGVPVPCHVKPRSPYQGLDPGPFLR